MPIGKISGKYKHGVGQAWRASCRRALFSLALLAPSSAAPSQTVIDLGALTPDQSARSVFIAADASASKFGPPAASGVSIGDLDNDGLDDLIIGSPYATTANGEQSGMVDVIFGAPGLGGANIHLASPPQGIRTIRILGPTAGSRAGMAVALSDFNHDGRKDLVIGAPGREGANNPPGKVYVLFGSPDPWSSIDLAAPPQTLTTLIGRRAGDQLGRSVAVGDFNADGLDDLAVGAPLDGSGDLPSGVVFIMWGRAGIEGTSYDLTSLLQDQLGVQHDGGVAFGLAGQSLAAGDFNGDGLSDLAIGCPTVGFVSSSMFFGPQTAGAACLVFGSQEPPSLDLSSEGDPAFLRFKGALPAGDIGAQVAMIDLNHDGHSDWVMGAPGGGDLTGHGAGREGSIGVLFGSPSPPGPALTDGALPAGTYLRAHALVNGEFAGAGLVPTDPDGDGRIDLACSAWRASQGSRTQSGKVRVFPSSLFQPDQTFQITDAATTETLTGAGSYDWLGAAAAAGDLNGDGAPDFFATAFLGSAGDRLTSPTARGYAYLLLADPSQAAPSAGGVARFRPGVAPLQPVGFPASLRVELGFADGDTAGGASSVMATRTRSSQAVSGLPAESLANVVWLIQSDRQSWTQAEVVLHYTDDEISSLPNPSPGGLVILTAPDIGGPWTPLPTQFSPGSRSARAATGSLGWFVLGAQP